jgi:hypothetical protein
MLLLLLFAVVVDFSMGGLWAWKGLVRLDWSDGGVLGEALSRRWCGFLRQEDFVAWVVMLQDVLCSPGGISFWVYRWTMLGSSSRT